MLEKLLEVLRSQTELAIQEDWESIGKIEVSKDSDGDMKVKVVDAGIAFYFGKDGNLAGIVNFKE